MARMHSSAAVTIHGAFADADGEPARFQRLKSVAAARTNIRKLLILLGLFVLAAGMTFISSIFGGLTPSF